MGRRKNKHKLPPEQPTLVQPTKAQGLIKFLRISSALLFAGGLGVIFVFFWPGVAITYLGLILIAINIFLESWEMKWRLAAVALPLVFIVLLSLWAWGSAPLEIQTLRHYGNYKDKEVIGGIHWTDYYSELRVIFTNPTNEEYEDLDALINTDLGIAATGWIELAPTCVLRLADPRLTDLRVTRKDLEGNIISEKPVNMLATPGPYHLHCDKLLRHDSIQMVFALVNMSRQPVNTGYGPIFGPKELPTWSTVQGTYKSMFRPFSFEEKRQLTGD